MNGEQAHTTPFLPDWPLTSEDLDIRFGHKEIARTLSDVVLSCPKPYTVGLFGKWGTGKTTIINLLQNTVSQQTNVGLVLFDVWKHEADGLRRFFLKDIVRQLRDRGHLSQAFHLDERVTSSITKTAEGRFTIDKRKLGEAGMILAILIVAIALGYFFTKGTQAFTTYLTTLFGTVIGGSLLLWLYQAGTQILTTETTTFGTDRFEDAHEFEDAFYGILDELEKAEIERLIVIIDNLDRCSHSKAVELLSTLKTYLAKDRDMKNSCVFVLACADEAITKHIENVYKVDGQIDAAFPPDEFLRKFFNVSISIPEFIDTELYTYTDSLLMQTGIDEFQNTDIVSVITTAFRNNPRQIKQFINLLTAHFLLAKERENSGLIRQKGLVSGNPAFLAKMLTIRQKFPGEYLRISRRGTTIKDLYALNNDPDYVDFLRATKTITAGALGPFVFLKQSDEELELRQAEKLIPDMLENDADSVSNIFIEVIAEKKTTSLQRIILSLISRNSRRQLELFNIVNAVLFATKQSSIVFEQLLYDKIADLLVADDSLKPKLVHFDPNVLFETVIFKCNKRDRHQLIADYLALLKTAHTEGENKLTGESVIKVFDQMRKYKNQLRENEIREINIILNESFADNQAVLALYQGNQEDMQTFVSDETLSKLITSLVPEDIDDHQLEQKTKFLLPFHRVAGQLASTALLDRLAGLIRSDAGKPYRIEKENLLQKSERLISSFKKGIDKVDDGSHFDNLASALYENATVIGEWENRRIFMPLLLWILPRVTDAAKQRHDEINELMRGFLSNSKAEAINFVLRKLGARKTRHLIEDQYSDIFANRVQSDAAVFDLVYGKASPEQRTSWLVALIKSDQWERAITKIEAEPGKVGNKADIVAALLEESAKADIVNKGRFFGTVNLLKCAESNDLIENFLSQIKGLLFNKDMQMQLIGHDALRSANYITTTARGSLTREIVEWLRNLDVIEAYQLHSTDTVLENWATIEKPVRDDFVDFVFDKLITRAITIDAVKLGFKCLMAPSPKPRYEDHKAHFQRVREREVAEKDPNIRLIIADGLKQLRPKKVRARNQAFWTGVDGLNS